MLHKKAKVAVVLAAVILCLSGAGMASAASNNDELALRTQMTTLGIDLPTQDSLIAKISSGQAPESELSDSIPVREVQVTSANAVGKRQYFSDGSARFVGFSAGSCSGAALQIVQQREANGLPALAQATTNFASFYPVTSRTFLLNLSVGNNAYWMSESN